jgi:hypothetical protein
MQVIEQLKKMDDERFLTIYTALEQNGFGPLDGEVAKVMKFRPHAIKKLPMPQRSKRAKRILETGANAELCYELFGTYLIREHKDLVTGFLDATGVEHEEGMIEDLENNKPDAKKLKDAIAELDGKFDAEDVTLYLALCAEQWPDVPELDALWRERLAAAVAAAE